jgi:RHH-type proline utilization regulon transcriptional repressor/proline dehydrogenase/delta 1-pyrroline-5-carboxylate dehydrogenase
MGGKNAIVVDADADLDEAVPAIVASAFGFAGQKCSAASRVLVCAPAADALLERLAGAVAALRVGAADDFATDVGPVIDEPSRDRLAEAVALGARTGRIAGQATALPAAGFFVPPTVLADLPDDSPLVHRELFGPVLVVEVVSDVAAACDRLEASSYALTAGLFSRSPGVVEEVVRRVPAGNLYVNREITGAMVGRQPFGGGRLSGIGAKAGGPDYLHQFVEARVVTENTMRHGLSV